MNAPSGWPTRPLGWTGRSWPRSLGDLSIWLVPGSICERGEDGQIFNTAVWLTPEGKLAASYRKIFPWRPYEPYRPSSTRPYTKTPASPDSPSKRENPAQTRCLTAGGQPGSDQA
jgi:predicted amidohydrolase